MNSPKVAWSLVAILVVALGAVSFVSFHRQSEAQFSTSYQAVLLTNGSVYFGHLSGYGTSQPVLTDVYYVASQANPETKQVTNALIKRGKELHEPDRMYLSPNQIVFVESVGQNSKVVQLISQASH